MEQGLAVGHRGLGATAQLRADPRPLATPAWSIDLVRSALGLQEAAARVIAAIGLRMLFLGLLGMLLMFATRSRHFDRRSVIALIAAPVLGICPLS